MAALYVLISVIPVMICKRIAKIETDRKATVPLPS